MYKFGKFIGKNRIIVLIIAILLTIPSIFGMVATKTNYDMLTYLPKDLESVKGQEVISDSFGLLEIAMLVLEDVRDYEVSDIVKEVKEVDGVDSVIWLRDIVDLEIPKEMLPKEISDMVYRDECTLVPINLSESSADDKTLKAIEEIRNIAENHTGKYHLSGIAPLLKDMIKVADHERGFYVLLAVVLAVIVLILTSTSFIIPILFLLGIGFAVLYNMGTNYFLGEISYITKAIAAVLQLGVTMDFSIFLYHRYEEEREKKVEKIEAMAVAISNTASSVSGAALTTIAGFLALAFMKLGLGKDIGIVMAKGVFLGIISTITILPSLILVSDSIINKFNHKDIMPKFNKLAKLVTKKPALFIIIAVIISVPAIYGQQHTEVYYNVDRGLPQDMESIDALNHLKETYDMQTTDFIGFSDDLSINEVNEMVNRIEKLDGIESVLAYPKMIGPMIPTTTIPEEYKKIFFGNGYQRILVNSSYSNASDEVSNQLQEINDIVKEYDDNAFVTGEAQLTKDLITISDIDFKNVNLISILVVFLIIAIVLKSITLPIILVASIQLAIFINMGIPTYTHTVIPFVSSIVIGCIQLGSTVDYAILLTTRFKEELLYTSDKRKAMEIALSSSGKSIVTSAASFFAATIGVVFISKIDLISSLTSMMARGAIISMLVILFILPSILLVLEPIINKTTHNWKKTNSIEEAR